MTAVLEALAKDPDYTMSEKELLPYFLKELKDFPIGLIPLLTIFIENNYIQSTDGNQYKLTYYGKAYLLEISPEEQKIYEIACSFEEMQGMKKLISGIHTQPYQYNILTRLFEKGILFESEVLPSPISRRPKRKAVEHFINNLIREEIIIEKYGKPTEEELDKKIRQRYKP